MATILVVEDYAMSRQVICTLLGYMGHRVLEAADGVKALDIVHSEHPDLIITDIMMPNMDGMEFVRRLRTSSTHKEIPVIFYSAWCRHQEDIHLDEGLGCCRVIPKPSEPYFIIRTVNELLDINKRDDYSQLEPQASYCIPEEYMLTQGTQLQLSVLMDLGYSMVAERDPKRLLNTFCRAVRDILGCGQTLLAINRKTEAACYYMSQTGSRPVYSCPEHLLPSKDILEKVSAVRRPVRCEEATNNIMVVPFASPTRYYGWLSVMNKSNAGPFSKRDEEISMALSTQAALAYENILLVEQLKKNNETKGMFITNISHELRTPLNILLSNAQLAKLYLQNDEELDKGKLLKKVDMQIRNCNRLLRLVNNFIDLNRIGSNFFELKPVNCNIVEIVEAITTSIVEYAGTKGIELVFDTEEEEIMLACDLDCIERIILNLLSNAIKFTPREGSILVDLKRNNDCAHIRIKDTGIGISKDKLNYIFERFRQVDSLTARKNEGSGIGLTLVKLLTEMHGGRVYVNSEYGEGSEFVVELPINLKGIDDAVLERASNPSNEDIIQRIQLEFSDIYF